MNSSKGDAIKHSQVKGASNGENEPLFPRLHINETEKAGPRAPPRNKMALYEQFTVPSHRFVKRNQTTSAGSQREHQVQYGLGEYQHPYTPYYMQPPLACGNSQHVGPVYARPTYGVSSGDMSCDSTVVTEDEAPRAPKQLEKSSSFEVSKRMPKHGESCNARSKCEKKEKVASELNVPIVVPAANINGKKTPYSKSVSQQKHHEIADLDKSTSTCIMDVDSESPVAESQCVELPDLDKSEDNVIFQISESGMRQSVYESFDEQDESAGSLTLPVQSCQQSTLVNEAQQTECQSTAEPEISNEHGNGIECTTMKKGDEKLAGRSAVISTLRSIPNEQQTPMPGFAKDMTKCGIPKHQEKGTSNESRTAVVNSVKRTREVSGESNTIYEVGELSKLSDNGPSQPGVGKDDNSEDTPASASASLPEQTIKPKDVIRAVGQQQFWKARKALLRQQRVFSDQVFQLHKLIKVQQLLAETPGILMDEEMQFGAIEESDESPYSNVLERANCFSEKEQNTVSNARDGGESQLHETEGHPESVSNQLEQQATSNDAGLNQSMPASGHGVSAWGYPSIGMGQWMSPMDVQGRPFMFHPPFAAPPFGGPYGSAMPGPMPPMVPFGIPYYGPSLPPDMHQNYGSVGSSNNFDPSVGPNPINAPKGMQGSWNFTPYDGAHIAGPVKDVPTGSGASVNQSSTTLPSMRTLSVPGMQYQLGMNVHRTHQSENSSPSVLRKVSNAKTSSYEHHDKKGFELRGGHQSCNAQFQENARSLEEKEDSARNVMGWIKDLHGKEGARVSVRNISLEKCIEHGGLQLFPLVSLDGRGKAKKGKTEEQHGRVIKAVPHPAVSTTQSAAGILLSLQRERQQ